MTPDKQPVAPSPIPAGGGLFKKLGIEYLKGLDAMIRLVGAYIILAIFCSGIWALARGLFYLTSHTAMADTASPWIALLCFPLLTRYSLVGAGFLVPPLFSKRFASGTRPDKSA